MVDGGKHLPGAKILRGLAHDIRTAELPDARMWILYPIVLTAIAILLIINAVNSESHTTTTTTQPLARTTTTTTVPATTKVSTTEKLPTEQGTTLYVPIAAVQSIKAVAGISLTTQASSIVIVSHTAKPPSFTCAVTFISSSGATFQKLVTATESNTRGAWTASDA
jgi:hypothetical protein